MQREREYIFFFTGIKGWLALSVYAIFNMGIQASGVRRILSWKHSCQSRLLSSLKVRETI
jgi:hypothetical protein